MIPNAMMKFKTISIFFAICCAICSTANALDIKKNDDGLWVYDVKTLDDARAFFKYKAGALPIISGHRGGKMHGYPENHTSSFEELMKKTPTFLEIDPVKTKDGVIVLFHDATLERTTTGKGKMSDLTFAELRELNLKDGYGVPTEYKVQTLEEVIKWSRGKCVLNLDNKGVPYEDILALQEKLGATNIMITSHSAAHARWYYDRNKNQMFSAHIRNKKQLEEYKASGIPWKNFIVFIGFSINDENREVYEFMKKNRVRCMISVGPQKDLPAAIDSGIGIIEADLSLELADLMKEYKSARAKKQISTDK